MVRLGYAEPGRKETAMIVRRYKVEIEWSTRFQISRCTREMIQWIRFYQTMPEQVIIRMVK